VNQAEQLADIATSRGLDDLSAQERRARARELLDRSDLSEEENVELDVLLLMARGITEASARADLLLRQRQAQSIQEQSKAR
jgi:hypothetical protein